MQIVGNWNYAGTQKFISHALNAEGTRTLCGMNVSELMARRGQQWEEDDTENCGCAKCNRHLKMLALDAAIQPPAEHVQNSDIIPAGEVDTQPRQ